MNPTIGQENTDACTGMEMARESANRGNTAIGCDAPQGCAQPRESAAESAWNRRRRRSWIGSCGRPRVFLSGTAKHRKDRILCSASWWILPSVDMATMMAERGNNGALNAWLEEIRDDAAARFHHDVIDDDALEMNAAMRRAVQRQMVASGAVDGPCGEQKARGEAENSGRQ